MRGIDLCVMHGGARRVLPDGNGRAERRALTRLEKIGLLPLELLALPVWRKLTGLPTAKRAPMRLALVQAWDRRELEPLHWAQVQRRALELGAMPGKRQKAAPWYENQ